MILNKIKSTEKIVRMIEADNTVVFETPLKIKKPEIKSEVENLFDVKVASVNTYIRRNKKLAYVKLKPEFKAVDIATKLGLM
jgi:large subunit ribosomal protein L23